MENKIWQTFTHENVPYMLKTLLVDDTFTVYLTDLRSIWTNRLSSELLYQRFQELNVSLDISVEECQKEILELTKNVATKDTATVENHADNAILHLSGKILDFPVIYNFELSLCDQEIFFTEVTLPLAKTIKVLEEQNQNFCELLVQKDREISEYMMEKGDTISKKYLITQPFDKAECSTIKDDSLMLGCFGVSSAQFWNTLCNEDETIEQPPKKLKISPSKQKVKVYSSKTKKSGLVGIKYNGKAEK